MPNQYETKWTPRLIAKAKQILGTYASVKAALPAISKSVGFEVTAHSIRDVFHRNREKSPVHFLRELPTTFGGVPKKFHRILSAKEERFENLVNLVRQPVSFSDLCDKLDASPARVRELILQARSNGIKVHVENNHVGLKLPEPVEKVQATQISPVIGQRQRVAVITDTHLGSKYCLRDQLRDFVEYAYAKGVREILHIGDVLDGDYRHGKFEMTHMGIDEQTRDLYETLPCLDGLTYHGITGNHDNTFTESSGVDAGEFIESYFRKRGRNDFKFYGNRGAFIKIRGAVIHLWHPCGTISYAVSYKMQKRIEAYSSGMKPHVLLIGHWHRFCYLFERGVHALACGTFQGGQSAFSKSLPNGAPAIGGTILGWDLTKDGTLRNFSVERRSYFELETPVHAETTDYGIGIVPGEQVVEVKVAKRGRR